MGTKFEGLPTIERIRQKVSYHTEMVLCDWANHGHGANLDAIINSEHELVDFIAGEIRREVECARKAVA